MHVYSHQIWLTVEPSLRRNRYVELHNHVTDTRRNADVLNTDTRQMSVAMATMITIKPIINAHIYCSNKSFDYFIIKITHMFCLELKFPSYIYIYIYKRNKRYM